MQNPIEFEFGWKALNLLGKTLYSNAWNAISELVANGFDAHAHNVYVRIDAIRKDDATIEILDDGDGMDSDGLSLYAKVGFNKRKHFSDSHGGAPAPTDIMGRKGIGKLAALYLSSFYYIVTKTGNGGETCWKMFFEDNPDDENKKPSLLPSKRPPLLLSDKWADTSSGTILRLQKVNLSGLSERAYQALSVKLANCFSLSNVLNRHIYLCARRKNTDPFSFQEAVKHIAFRNMAFIATSPRNDASERERLMQYDGVEQKIPYRKIPSSHYLNRIEVSDWESTIQTSGFFPEAGGPGSISYVLTGWIGIHSTIKSSEVEENDDDFLKNQFYNPNQLRLYIRNKLAMENFLNVLNSTHTYSNYIEGEIHFDLLDDDSLPDIATSNRQGLDEHDDRMALLQRLVTGIIHGLIQKRVALAKKIREEEERLLTSRATSAKKQFADEVDQEIAQTNLPESDKANLTRVIVNKVQGDVLPKDQYQIFISHSSADKPFGDFLYTLLVRRGVRAEEVFYTSKDGDVHKYDDVKVLSVKVKECILQQNTLMVFLVGRHYKSSEFCMFEGGAGWATRSVDEYPIISVKPEHIPKFLTNDKLEFGLWKNGKIELSQETYLFVVHLLNRMIRHVNGGRRIKGEPLIPEFPETAIPDQLELFRMHKTVEDYMDNLVKECWEAIVVPKLGGYLADLNNSGT